MSQKNDKLMASKLTLMNRTSGAYDFLISNDHVY